MYIVFDIGATNTRIGLSVSGDNLDVVEVFRTPEHYTTAMGMYASQIQTLTKGKQIRKAVVGFAGALDVKKSRISSRTNLTSWKGKPLKRDLERMMHTDITLENDAALAGLGEAVYGAGRKYRIVAYLTVSTGFGGVRIVNKDIDQHIYGFEPSKQVIGVVRSGNGSFRPLSLEEFVSGVALEKRYRKTPELIRDKKIWSEVETFIGYAVDNAIVLWSPECVILGGGIMNNQNISLTRIRAGVRDWLAYLRPPRLARATLGDASGLYGGLALIRSQKK